MIGRSFDEETGIIHVKAAGPWDAAEIDEHFSSLRSLIEQIRATRSIPIRVLVDVRDAPPRSPLVEARIASRKQSIYGPGDKVAILTNGLEDKMHVRSFLDGADLWAWQNELAAEQWLLLPSERSQAS